MNDVVDKFLEEMRSRLQGPSRADLMETERVIMAKLSTLASTLEALADKLDKVFVEVTALKTALADVDLPPGAVAALDRLTAIAQAVDDINPDVQP